MSQPHESIDAILAKNLVAARVTRRVTQKQLAQLADVSRATIAQIETGSSDPRLSTVAELATALGIPLVLLLFGLQEIQGIAAALKNSAETYPDLLTRVLDSDVQRMRRILHHGMLKDRLRVARLGSSIAGQLSKGAAAEICSALFSATLPGEGTLAGILLGEALALHDACSPAAI